MPLSLSGGNRGQKQVDPHSFVDRGPGRFLKKFSSPPERKCLSAPPNCLLCYLPKYMRHTSDNVPLFSVYPHHAYTRRLSPYGASIPHQRGDAFGNYRYAGGGLLESIELIIPRLASSTTLPLRFCFLVMLRPSRRWSGLPAPYETATRWT